MKAPHSTNHTAIHKLLTTYPQCFSFTGGELGGLPLAGMTHMWSSTWSVGRESWRLVGGRAVQAGPGSWQCLPRAPWVWIPILRPGGGATAQTPQLTWTARGMLQYKDSTDSLYKDQGPISIWSPSFPGMGIPMLKIRRSQDRLIFNIGIPILVRHLYIETPPRWSWQCLIFIMRLSLLVKHHHNTEGVYSYIKKTILPA